jgi:putative lipoprotein (rSAM/lipoprotein system)
MKRIRKILLSKYSLLLSLILGLMGIQTGCSPEYGSPVAEYGAPMAKYIVNGKITSDSTGDAINHIRVTNFQIDTVYSDINGNYNVEFEGSPMDTVTFQISFTDIDSSQNGNFQNLNTVVEFDDPQFTGGDGNWDYGETTKEFNVQLLPKN